MDAKVFQTGIQYEKLMMRAFRIDYPSAIIGADRKIYYLLYYIKIGLDLRKTGYAPQFNEIKQNLKDSLKALLEQELHPHQKRALRKLAKELEHAWSEPHLERIISKAMESSTINYEMETA